MWQSITNSVWIYGGSFMTGSASVYDGIEQAKRGNIVAIIQYRLALFGFMNLYDTELDKTIGGNYGLMDQQLALKYISENAQNIGGDRNKITINGESAGGMSVALQLLNEQSGILTEDFSARKFRQQYMEWNSSN